MKLNMFDFWRTNIFLCIIYLSCNIYTRCIYAVSIYRLKEYKLTSLPRIISDKGVKRALYLQFNFDWVCLKSNRKLFYANIVEIEVKSLCQPIPLPPVALLRPCPCHRPAVRTHPNTGLSRRQSPFGQSPFVEKENGTPAETQRRGRFPNLFPGDDVTADAATE